MPQFAPIEPEEATGRAAELLTQAHKALGVVPNMTKVMANSPALLDGYLALFRALGTGVLPAGVRERLAITTAQFNGCEYCLSAHTYIGANIAKVDEAELSEARKAHSNDPHIEAILSLSRVIAENQGVVSADELERVRAAGVTEAEIGEVVGHIALNVLTNYFNILANVANDWPVVSL